MKLLQINSSANSGSTGRIAEDIGRVFMDNGHESYIAYGRTGNTSASKTIRIGNKLSNYLHFSKSMLLDRHGFGSREATRLFIKQVEKIDPDVIGLHNIHGYYINIKYLFEFLNRLSIPIFWTLHDCWSYTGHCSYYDSHNCYNWETECRSCPKTAFYPRSLFFDQSNRNFREKSELFGALKDLTIITPSRWLKDEVSRSFLQKYECRVIHNGTDTEIFCPVKTPSTREEKIILGVANIWDSRKGLNDFLRIAAKLDSDWKIVLIGLQPAQIKKLPANIIGIERTENVAQLVEWYSGATVFVNPTYQDNFPTTNIEALACGTPVITYRTGGSPEAVDEKTGVVVEKGNIDALIQAIYAIADRIKQEEKINEACRERAQTYFNKSIQFNRYLDMLPQFSR